MKTADPQQELAYIKGIISDSRQIIADNGTGFILWGILISVGMVLHYIAVVNSYAWNLAAVWGVIFAVAIGVTILGILKERSRQKVETLGGKFLGAIWIGVIITITLNGFLGNMYPALAASILGLGYFPTGYATGFSMFRYLAAGWWIAAVVMYLFPGLYTILFFAALLIVLQVIPGIIVYRRCQKDVLNAAPITL
jgi:hypothetical protein